MNSEGSVTECLERDLSAGLVILHFLHKTRKQVPK